MAQYGAIAQVESSLIMMQQDSRPAGTSSDLAFGSSGLSRSRQSDLYAGFDAMQLRTFYRLRRQWLHEQSELRLRTLRSQEFARYLVESGRLSG